MKFTIAGSRTICSRKDNTVADEEAYRRVAEIDAHAEEAQKARLENIKQEL